MVIVPVTNKVGEKWRIYQGGSAFFNMEKKSQNERSFSNHLLPFVKIQELRLKENHLIVRPNIQNDRHSEIKGLSTLHAAFLALSHALLTGYSTSDK